MSVEDVKGTDRLAELDVFRGLAAISIVVYHYTARFHELYGHAPTMVLTESGPYGGIDMFFVMSGFLMLGILAKTRRALDFVVLRASRLYPAYWVAVVLTFVVLTISELPGREVTMKEALVNLTMLSMFFDVPYVDGVYWTLSVNICFYAILLVLFLLRALNRIEVVSIFWLSAVFLIHLLQLELPLIVQVASLSEYAHLFIAGMTIYRISRYGLTVLRGVLLGTCIAAALYIHGARLGILDAAFAFALLATTRGWLRWIVSRPLVFLGTISYPLFLIHQNIGYVILRHTYARNLNPYIGLIAAFLLMLVVATVITYYVEQPALRRLRQGYRRFRDRNAVSTSAA